MSFSIESPLLNQMQSKSYNFYVTEHSSGTRSHRCICSSICVLLLLYSPTISSQSGLLRKDLQTINEESASEKDSVCSFQLCHLNNCKERFGDLALKFNLKVSYLGRNSQRQRKKQKGYEHYDQVFPEG